MKVGACKDCEYFVKEDESCVRHEKLIKKIKGCSRTQGAKMFYYSGGAPGYYHYANKKKKDSNDND